MPAGQQPPPPPAAVAAREQRAVLALGHPAAPGWAGCAVPLSDPSRRGDLAAVVGYVEDRKVRALDISERAGLRSAGAAFDAALLQYLAALGCPHTRITDAAVGWLLARAVNCEYEDRGAECNARAAARAAAAAPPPADERRRIDAALRGLCASAGVPYTSLEADGPAALGALAAKARAAETAPSAAGGAAAAAPPPDAAQFPLGFSSDDAAVDERARVLRMLYISDLRRLQDDVSRCLSAAQAYTADPKTNSTLGKVGYG